MVVCETCGQVVEVVSDQMVTDILTTAFEGGINYWAVEVKVPDFKGQSYAAEVPSAGGVVYVVEDEFSDPDYRKEHKLNRKIAEKGIRLAAAHFGSTVVNFYEDHDSDMADTAVQLAVLGEIVYG